MPVVKTFGEQPLFSEKDLKAIDKTTATVKYAVPLEVDIYGDIIIHHFWPMSMFHTVNPRYLDDFDIHNGKMPEDPIVIKCGNCLQDAVLAFDIPMTNEANKLFNEILSNIVMYTKTSHYPAIGIIEVPVGVTAIDANDVPGVQVLIGGNVTLTNIICGFDNDADMFKHFDFAYNRENVELLPPVVKFDLNHNMY